MQESTWQKAINNFNDQPKDNPGPGHYNHDMQPFFEYANKSASLKPGFTFPK